jgi:hypothetical protein
MQAPKEFAMPKLGEILLVTHSDICSNGSDRAPAIVTRVWSLGCVNLTVFPDMGSPKLLSSVCHLTQGVLDPNQNPCGWFREGE